MKKTIKRIIALFLIIGVVGLGLFLIFAPAIVEKGRNAVTAHDPYPVSPAAQTLHDSLIIGDWHADSLLWNRDLNKRADYGQVDIPRLLEGNVAIQVFTAVTKSPSGLNYEQNSAESWDNITTLAMAQLWPLRSWNSLLERALYQARKLHEFESAAPQHLKIIRNLGDLEEVLSRRAAGEQIVGALLGIEGGHPLEGDLNNLQYLQDAGYRLIGLQHFFDNELGGSLHGESNAGLSEFGKQVVIEIARRGLILDLAHSSQQVARDVLALTDMPLVVSHTGVHGQCATKRNYPDTLMQEIAATGGVIGIGYWLEVTCDDTPEGVAKVIQAAIEIVGEDAVSLGSDFDGSVRTRFDTSELAALTQALLDIGISEPQIRKVMGQNMMRVLRQRFLVPR